jgi:dTDP-4-amino-4,6-dideoxygalactose transaminase
MAGSKHNAHLYYLSLEDVGNRASFVACMKRQGVLYIFHCVPLPDFSTFFIVYRYPILRWQKKLVAFPGQYKLPTTSPIAL